MSRPVPAWVKAKGFSTWKSYMASIRPARSSSRRKARAIRKRNPKRTDRVTKRCSTCGRTDELVRTSSGKIFCEKCLPKKNPARSSSRRKARANPIAVYNPAHGKILPIHNVEIRYQRISGYYRGQWFRHIFKSSVNLIGLQNGSILIKSKSGKKLWGSV